MRKLLLFVLFIFLTSFASADLFNFTDALEDKPRAESTVDIALNGKFAAKLSDAIVQSESSADIALNGKFAAQLADSASHADPVINTPLESSADIALNGKFAAKLADIAPQNDLFGFAAALADKEHLVKLVDHKRKNTTAILKNIKDAVTNKKATLKKQGRYHIDIEISPEQTLSFTNVTVGEDLPVKFEEYSRPGKFANSVAIDLTGMNFTNATYTAVARRTELYKCKEWNYAAQTCEGTWVKILDLVPGQPYTIVLSANDPALSEGGGFFFDGFENGITNNWTITGSAGLWTNSTSDPFNGTQHAQSSNTGNNNPTTIRVNVSTAGFPNIRVRYARKLIGLDNNDEFISRWYDGTTWNILEQISNVDDSVYVLKEFVLPEGAWNNQLFAIDFSCESNQAAESCNLDDVSVFDPVGNVTASADLDDDQPCGSAGNGAGQVSSGALADTYTSNDIGYVLQETQATSGNPSNRNQLLSWRFDFTNLTANRIETILHAEANTSGEIFRTYWSNDGTAFSQLGQCNITSTTDATVLCSIPDDANSTLYIRFIDNNDDCSDSTDTSVVDNLSIDLLAIQQTPAVGCDTINESTTLNADISAGGTCFTINDDNITLDCAGFTVTYATSDSGNGVFANNRNNITIKDCNFITTNSVNASNFAIRLANTRQSIVANNSITTNGTSNNHGILLDGSSNKNIIKNNTILASGNANFNVGIYLLTGSAENNVSNNSISTSGTTSNHGILLQTDAQNNTVMDNIIKATGSTNFNVGIYLLTNSSGNIISRNDVNTSGVVDNTGILVQTYSELNNITDNTVRTFGTGGSNEGIFLLEMSSNNKISQNQVFTNGTDSNHGIILENRSSNNDVVNNTVNTSGTGLFNIGIFAHITAQNNTLENNTISTSGLNANHGFFLTAGANNNTISFNTITVNGTFSFGIGIENISIVTITNNTLITNVTELYIFDTNETELTDVDINNYSIVNVSLTVKKKGKGKIKFKEKVTQKGKKLKNDIVIDTQQVFVNTTSAPGFNQSADITFFNFNTTTPDLIIGVDYENDGTYIDCTLDSTCVLLQNDQAIEEVLFNVSHFTRYAVDIARVHVQDVSQLTEVFLNDTPDLKTNSTAAITRNVDFTTANLTLPSGELLEISLINQTKDIYNRTLAENEFVQRGQYRITYFTQDTAGLANGTVNITFTRAAYNIIDPVNRTNSELEHVIQVNENSSGVLNLTIESNGTSAPTVKVFDHNSTAISSKLGIDNTPVNEGFVRRFAIDAASFDFNKVIINHSAIGTSLFECTDWDFDNQNCEGNWKKVKQVTQGQEYNATILKRIKTGFAEDNNTLDLLDEKNFLLNVTETVINNSDSTNNVTLAVEHDTIKTIVINELNATPRNDIRIDTTAPKLPKFTQAYALDTAGTNFTGGNMTITARGTRLVKCADWNITTQKCGGNWVTIRTDLVPGQNYTINISPGDPGFGEINASDAWHLDENRTIIENIFDNIVAIDGNFSPPIPHNDFARVQFAENLTNGSYIDFVARANITNDVFVQIFPRDNTTIVGTSNVLGITATHEFVRISMPANDLVDAFDMRTVSSSNNSAAAIEYDFIHDQRPVGSTEIRQIIKGSGVTTDAVNFTVNFTTGTGGVPLENISKAFHLISYRHQAAANTHNTYFRSSNITSPSEFVIYANPTAILSPVEFDYAIIEFTAASPIDVQRSEVNAQGNLVTVGPINPVGNLSQVSLLSLGHTQLGVDTTVGSEEYDQSRLVTGDSWELAIDTAPNSGPQPNRVEIIDWNDGEFIKRVQRGLVNMTIAQNVVTVDPPIAVNVNHTILFVSARPSGAPFSLAPSNISMFAFVNSTGSIVIERQFAAPPLLEISWELTEFQPTAVRVQQVFINVSADSVFVNATIPLPVTENRTIPIGTSFIPFGLGASSRTTDSTPGATSNNMFTMRLINATVVEVRRNATASFPANLSVQIWEFLIGPQFNLSNLTIGKIDNPDPVDAGAQLNYTIEVNSTGDNAAFNVTVVDAYPSQVVFDSAVPAPLTGTNNTFILGNLTNGTIFRINITVNVSSGVSDGVVINNTANVSFQNETSQVEVNFSVTEGTTVQGPNVQPIVENVTLNSTLGTNLTIENLTVFFDSFDNDTDSVKNITNFFLNNQSITLVNMPFEGGSSSTFTRDYSPIGNNGTVLTAFFNSTGGVDGFGAYKFEITDFIETNTTGFRTGNMTMMAWVNADAFLPAFPHYIFGHTTQPAFSSRIQLYADFGGQLRVGIGASHVAGTGSNLTAGEWHHVALAFNDTEFFAYLDGVLDFSSTFTGLTAYSGLFDIGNDGSPTLRNEAWNGTIDEVLIFNRSLSAEQIFAIYNNRTTTIVSNETFENETWRACVTPNDRTEDGTEVCSNNLTIMQPVSLINISNVSIIKTDSPDPVAAGAQLSYTINITSTGNGTAFNVTVVDAYPSQVVFDSASPAPLSGTNNTFVVGNLTQGTNFTINITVNVSSSASGVVINNTANASFQNETSQVAINRTVTENTTVRAPAPPIVLNFTLPTLPDGTTTTNRTVPVNISIESASNLSELLFNWNGTNFTIYNRSLVLMYNLDNVSALGENNTRVVDIGNRSNDGIVLSGAVPNTTGKYGGSYSMDGLTGSIRVPNDASQNISGEGTWEFWVNLRNNNTCQTFLSKRDSVTIQNSWAMGLQFAGPPNIRFEQSVDGGLHNVSIFSVPLTVDEWRMFAFVYNASDTAQNARMYLDGIEIAPDSVQNPNLPIFFGVSDIFVGKVNNGSDCGLNGSIDEIRIWNTAFSAETIRQHYFSNLQRYNATNWTFFNNQSKNTTTELDFGTYSYFGCGTDELGRENCTNTRQVTIVQTVTGFNISNISLTKTDSPDPVDSGAQLSYQIFVNSTGNTTAFNVTINETYPAEVVFDSAEPAPLTGTNNTFILGNLTAGTNFTINITVNVTSEIINGTVITNSVNATYQNETNPVVFSRAVTETTTVLAPVFNVSTVAITKIDSPDSVDAGAQLSYQIFVNVTGNGTAFNVTVNETYPTQTVFDSALPAPLTGTNNTFILGNLTPGTDFTINITVNVTSEIINGTVITNTVNMTFQNETSFTSRTDVTESTTVLAPVFNVSTIAVTKTDSPDPANAGGQLNYSIFVNVTGNGTAFNVTINETYPQNVVFDNATPLPSLGTNNTFILGNLTAGTNFVINITVNVSDTVPNGTIITNTVNATFQNESSTTARTDVVESTTILADVPLVQIFREQPDGVGIGTVINVRFVVWNNETSAINITAATLVDDYPAGWQIVGLPTNVNATNNGNNVTIHFGALNTDELITFNYSILSIDSTQTDTFSALMNFTFDGQNTSQITLPDFNTQINSTKAFFDVELDLDQTTDGINRTIFNNTQFNGTITIKHTGSLNINASIGPVQYLWYFNTTLWNVTVPSCAGGYIQNFSNAISAINCTYNTFNINETQNISFNINSTFIDAEELTNSNTTADPILEATSRIFAPNLFLPSSKPAATQKQPAMPDRIKVRTALHLDENRTPIKDISDVVRERDYSWTEPIPTGDYVRATFEQNLTPAQDITVYAKADTASAVEVYERDKDKVIAGLGPILDEGKYKTLLTNLSGWQDTFDLKIIQGAIKFDQIVDPSDNPNKTRKKVIVIGVDGMQNAHYIDLLNAGLMPNITRLMGARGKNITVNMSGHGTTSTAPGNAELFTGLNDGLTGVTDNTCNNPVPDGNTTFERLKLFNSSIATGYVYGKGTCYIPEGVFGMAVTSVDWRQNRTSYSQQDWPDGTVCANDTSVATKSTEFITNNSNESFFLVIYFGTPDCSGHAGGDNSENYNRSFFTVDEGVGIVLNSLIENGIENDTQVFITPDHGWNEGTTGHSTTDFNTRTIPLITNNASLVDNSTTDSLFEQCDITPTILDFFGMTEDQYPDIINNGCSSMIFIDDSTTFLINETVTFEFPFQDGSFNNTMFNATTTVIQLNTSQGTTGTYISQVLNVTAVDVAWINISLASNAYGELPSGGVNESTFRSRNIDMVDNVFLFRFNNQTAFGENGSFVNDFSGNAHDAYCNFGQGPCPQFVDNKFFGGAFNFTYVIPEDNNTHFVINDDPNLTLHTQATMSAWVFFRGAIVDDHKILDHSGLTAGVPQWNWGLTDDAAANATIRFLHDDGGLTQIYSTSIPPRDEWVHVALVRNGTTGTNFTFYLNGEPDGISAGPAGVIDPDDNMWIADEGRTIGRTDEGWNGFIEELSYWNRSLTDQEIKKIYQRGVTRFNLSVRSCDDAACSGETFTNVEDSFPSNLSVANNTYFQYRIAMETNNSNHTPEIHDVTVVYQVDQATAAEGEGTFLVNTTAQTNFSLQNGTFSLTQFNSAAGFVDLNNSPNGTFTSQVLNASTVAVSWDNISWISSAFGELPDNRQSETTFGSGNANMTGNILLQHFDELSGSTATDTSGDGRNGVILGNGSIGHPGIFNTAYDFNGSTTINHTTLNANNSPLKMLGDLSIMLWMNTREIPAGTDQDQLFVWTATGETPETNTLYELVLFPGNNLTYRHETNGGSDFIANFTAGIAANQWYHIGLTRDNTTNTVSLYIDGSLLSSETYALAPEDGSGSPGFFIGSDFAGNTFTRFFNGSIDEFAMFNRTLSAQEVKDSYERGATSINMSVRSCDDAACSGETFVNIDDVSLQNLSVADNQYFQYNVSFDTNNTNNTPELYNVTIGYTAANCPMAVTQDTNLSQDLTSAGTCLTFANDDVVLDCNGFSISGDGTGMGLNITNRENVTIRNCSIEMFSVGLLLEGTNDTTLTKSTFSSDTGISLELMSSSNTRFLNTSLWSNGTWIFTDSGSTGATFTNTTFEGQNSSIIVLPNVSMPASTNVSIAVLNTSFNQAFLNSTNLSFLNTSSIVTFRGITFTTPLAQIDYEGDGVFENCPDTICTTLSQDSNVFVFNVTQFSTFSSTEGAVNISLTKIDNPDPVNTFTLMEYVIIINVTTGNASNISLTELYPSQVIFNISQPDPITGTNTTFVIGNYSAPAEFTANITVFVPGIVNNTELSNFVNISFQNTTGAIIRLNVTENTTVITGNKPPVIENVTLTSTSGDDLSTDNLTVSFGVVDNESDTVKNITNFLVNGTSILRLNMPFEGGSNGTLTHDHSGSDNEGIVDNATFTATGGYDGFGAYTFNGSNSVIRGIPNSTINRTTGSIEVWAQPNTYETAQMLVWTGASGGNGYGGQQELHLSIQHFNLSHGHRGFTFWYGDNDQATVSPLTSSENWTYVNTSDINTSVGQWQHVVVTWDLLAGVTRMYLNGTLVDEDNNTGESYNTSLWQDEIRIGRPEPVQRTYNGTLDEVRIYDRALSAEQIFALYNNRTDRIVANETIVGDVWQACVTGADANSNGTRTCSNNVTIVAAACPRVFAESTTLTADITCPDNAVILDADNITLNCAGFSIFYNSDGGDSEVGVLAENRTNVTVQNCIIRDINAAGALGVGINFTDVNDSLVRNNSIFTNGTSDNFGVSWLGSSQNAVVVENIIKSQGSTTGNFGIFADSITGFNFTSNNITTNGTFGNRGMRITASDLGTISNNFIIASGTSVQNIGVNGNSGVSNVNFTNNTIYTSGINSNFGVLVSSSSNFWRIEGNVINTTGSADRNYGIVLDGGFQEVGHIVNLNTIRTNGTSNNFGIYIFDDVVASTIENNTITTGGTAGFNVGINVNRTSVRNNVSMNWINTTGTSENYGILVTEGSNTTLLTRNTITTSGSADNNDGIRLQSVVNNNITGNIITTEGTGSSQGIRLQDGANNNRFEFNNISAGGTLSYGINILHSNGSIFNVTLLNNTVEWINTGANTLNNFTNITFEMPDGSINILPLVQINGSQDVTKQRLNITLNSSFLNSTNLTFFNESAIITLRGINLTDPEPVVDLEDDGTFETCSFCTELSFANSVSTFQTTQFSTFAVQETPPPAMQVFVETIEQHFIRVRESPAVVGQPDIVVIDTQIFFNDSHPRENQNITINSTIRNNGTADASSVVVQFFDNTSGVQIGSDFTITSIAAGGSVVVNQTYISIIGNRSILVAADPANTIAESNESNNNASRQLNVQAHTIFFGKILGNLTLSTDSSTFYTWNTTDAGILYFYDNDSNFNFSNLQALGFNTTNGTSFGDFAELDALLNMTNFNDSVTDLWASDNSTAVDVRNFTIFGRRIDKVPVLSSTVTGTFVTGILWDTEDDTTEEFDFAEHEDIVFITNINLSQSGASGSDIDYEIRIPSLMRGYQPSQNIIAFQSEIR